MVIVTFRFYEELNDFLAPDRRKQEFSVPCAQAATTKHMIEALGVPHTEVELILVSGESADFSRLLQDGDRVAVYPRFEALDVTPLRPVDKARVLDRLPPRVREHYERFSTCDACGRVYWEGSHWRNMRRLLDGLLPRQLASSADRDGVS